MDSDEKKQNLDLNQEKDIKKEQNPDSEKSVEGNKDQKSTTDSNQTGTEGKPKSKQSFKMPIKVILPAVIIVIAVILIAVFLFHPANKTAAVVSYSPINSLSNSGLDSIIGGNWTLVNNETINSTIVNEYASTGYFPPGTVAATLEEFAPSSEIPEIEANKTANVSLFETNVYYLNSSSETVSIFNEVKSELSREYANDSKIKYNSSTINNSSIIYINGKLNSSNSSLENVTELYLANGKSFVVADISNGNLDYSQAKGIVNSLFS